MFFQIFNVMAFRDFQLCEDGPTPLASKKSDFTSKTVNTKVGLFSSARHLLNTGRTRLPPHTFCRC
jgi:hypothetical protein